MTRTDDAIRTRFAKLADTAAPSDRLLHWLDTVAAADTSAALSPEALPTPIRRAFTIRRSVFGGALVAAAVIAAVMVLPAGGHSGIAHADPIVTLTAASAYAQMLPDVVPEADQFYYVKQQGGQESWVSVDGTHDGEIRPVGGPAIRTYGCRNGVALAEGNYVGLRLQRCTPDPAFLADAPTTSAAMTTYLQARYGSAGINGVGKGIDAMLDGHFLRPAALAALFQTVTHFSGLHVVDEKGVGANVIGVTWADPPTGTQPDASAAVLLFDSSTHAYLGLQTTGANGEKGGGLRGPQHVAIVNVVGQRA